MRIGHGSGIASDQLIGIELCFDGVAEGGLRVIELHLIYSISGGLIVEETEVPAHFCGIRLEAHASKGCIGGRGEARG